MIEFRILIYDNSNPIMDSLLSAACAVMEFNCSQARFPLLGGPFLPGPQVQPELLEGAEWLWDWGVRGGKEGRPGLRSGRLLQHDLWLAAALCRTNGDAW